jgi:hypothetical protein
MPLESRVLLALLSAHDDVSGPLKYFIRELAYFQKSQMLRDLSTRWVK